MCLLVQTGPERRTFSKLFMLSTSNCPPTPSRCKLLTPLHNSASLDMLSKIVVYVLAGNQFGVQVLSGTRNISNADLLLVLTWINLWLMIDESRLASMACQIRG